MGKTQEPKKRLAEETPQQSLERLIREQGVRPFENLDDFAKLWPAEFDPDEFNRWLAADRAARRAMEDAKAD